MSDKLLYMEVYNKLKHTLTSTNSLYKLKSERDLAKEFNVSRVTIRRSLEFLVADNLIKKSPRSANFVKNELFRYDIGKGQSLKETFEESGITYAVDVKSFSKIYPNIKVCKVLEINKSEKVFFIERIISVKKQVIIYEESYLHVSLFPNMEKNDSILKYDYIEKSQNVKLNTLHQEITAIQSTPKLEQLFKIKNQAILRIATSVQLQNGIMCDFTYQYYHPKYTFTLTQHRV